MGNKNTGGIYKNLKMNIRAANALVIVTGIILVLCLAFAVSHNGFTVSFETNGGSYVEPCRVMYGDKINAAVPEKQNSIFDGWYTDKACTVRWDTDADTATESITLYARWKDTGSP